jgi:hypothetical protein
MDTSCFALGKDYSCQPFLGTNSQIKQSQHHLGGSGQHKLKWMSSFLHYNAKWVVLN